jgi:hypothetical protein
VDLHRSGYNRLLMAPSIVSSASAATNTVTMPTHAIGDMIVVWAYRGASATAPTIPSSQGWMQAAAPTGSTNSAVLCVKLATSASHTTGTWTNATGIIIIVVRGHAGIGTVASSAAASATITYPALTVDDTGSSSWALRFAGVGAGTNITTNSPSTTPNTFVAGTSTVVTSYSSNGTISANLTSGTQSTNSGTARHCAASIEIIAAGAPSDQFSEDFSSNSFATNFVSRIYSGSPTIATATGAMQFSGSGATQSIAFSRKAFDLTGKSITIQCVSVSSGTVMFGLANWGGGTSLSNNFLSSIYTDSGFTEYDISGVTTLYGSSGPSIGSGTYVRWTESGGTIFVSYSNNGGASYTAWNSTAAPAKPWNWRLMIVNNVSTGAYTNRWDNMSVVSTATHAGDFFGYM